MKTFKELEKEVAVVYPENEYKGVYESVLHLDTQIKYLQSKEGKAIVVESLGEIAYLEQVRKQVAALKSRQTELEFLRKLYK